MSRCSFSLFRCNDVRYHEYEVFFRRVMSAYLTSSQRHDDTATISVSLRFSSRLPVILKLKRNFCLRKKRQIIHLDHSDTPDLYFPQVQLSS